jgi:hypothetical protein
MPGKKQKTSRSFRPAAWLSHKLAQLHSLYYALSYLLLIPIFALAYSCHANEFYHSTAQYEVALNQTREHIVQELKKEIVATFKEVHKGDEATFKDWVINANDMEAVEDSLNIVSGEVSFRLSVDLTNGDARSVGTIVRVKFPLFNWEPGPNNPGVLYVFITIESPLESPVSTAPSTGIPFSKVLFPTSATKMDIPEDLYGEGYEKQRQQKIFMPIPKELYQEIRSLAKGNEGFPSTLKGGFWSSYGRMLYLSAVTITTLGYGDILPLTSMTRFLVSFESVWGIVLIGLFLNALAHERGEREEKERQALSSHKA